MFENSLRARRRFSSPNTPSYWVQMKHLALVERAGMQIMTPSNMLTYHLAHVLKSHASEFIGIQESMYLMSQMQENFAELVREATRVLPIITITDVLQRLVMEQISIRDMRTILEALVEWGQREKDPIILAEHIRDTSPHDRRFQAHGDTARGQTWISD